MRHLADSAAKQDKRLTLGLEAAPLRAQTWAERLRSQVRAAAAVCLRAGCSPDMSTATRRAPSHAHFLHHRQQTGEATWCRLQSQSCTHRERVRKQGDTTRAALHISHSRRISEPFPIGECRRPRQRSAGRDGRRRGMPPTTGCSCRTGCSCGTFSVP